MNGPSLLLADAILPSLIWIWPITVVLLLPIIVVEAQYARRRLNLMPGQAFRVFAVANVISTVIGFPLATVAANILQIKVQNHLYGNPQLNFEQWSRGGDPSNLARGFGQYPHWPLFAAAGLMFLLCFLISWWVEIGVHELQSFATELKQSVSRNTAIGIMCTVFGVLEYAGKCKLKVSGVKPGDIEYGACTEQYEAPFFTKEQATDIIALAREPFKTLFSIAWATGMRAGELMALTVDDLNFTNSTIRINKAADDNTRIVRQPKTKSSNTSLPMPTSLEAVLRNYLMHWTPNPNGYLFPCPGGTRPRSRESVVRYLKPILKKLGIPGKDVGLHAFRHGLSTELCEASVPLTVLKNQMRHSSVATTLRIYSHVIPQSQRDAVEKAAVSQNPIITSIITLPKRDSK